MAANIVYPFELPRAVADGYSMTTEENRSEFQPTVGVPRRRNRMRVTPVRITVQFIYTEQQYAAFDEWWDGPLQGGAQEFDIQIDIPYMQEQGIWYTCNWIGEPESETLEGGYWRVSGNLRSKYIPFFGRSPNTDDLAGKTQIGIGNATGNLLVERVLYGSTEIGISNATGRLTIQPLFGVTQIGINNARGRIRWVDLRGLGGPSIEPTGELQVGPP